MNQGFMKIAERSWKPRRKEKMTRTSKEGKIFKRERSRWRCEVGQRDKKAHF
jgi:hypothetical protein